MAKFKKLIIQNDSNTSIQNSYNQRSCTFPIVMSVLVILAFPFLSKSGACFNPSKSVKKSMIYVSPSILELKIFIEDNKRFFNVKIDYSLFIF